MTELDRSRQTALQYPTRRTLPGRATLSGPLIAEVKGIPASSRGLGNFLTAQIQQKRTLNMGTRWVRRRQC